MTAQIAKNPNLLKLLEWDSIILLISNHSHFSNTVNDRILSVKDLNSTKKAIYHTQVFLDNYYDESFLALKNSLSFLEEDESFIANIKKIHKNGICSLKEINCIVKLIEFHFSHHKDLRNINYSFEDDFNINAHKVILEKPLLKDFRSFYSEDDTYNYLNHPKLSRIYKDILEKESFIRKAINLTLNSLAGQVQYSSYDIINERYVIPIKSDSYNSSIGQIISRSDSGQTLYVEPTSLKNHNYKRLELMVELDKEINTLTIKYSNILKSEVNYLFKIIDLVLYLDTYFTRSTFCHTNNYSLPIISDNFIIDIKNAVHPLIPNCIENSFSVDKENGIIISGPNTGGKTATLKTLTLIMLFSKFGLATPTTFAKVPYYESIFYFGNDQQNLNEGLSSFAGEVKSYNSMLTELGEKSLIVIDEIFNSTSSEEASALAIGLFEQIHIKAQSHILVSTHHQMLKSIVHSKDEYISAHVGFDTETNKPTYKLNFGSPGASQALSIFRDLSLNDESTDMILKKAEKLLDRKMVSYEALLEKISHKENELLKLERENRTINLELKNQKASMDGILKLKLQAELDLAEVEIKKIFDKAQKILQDTKSGNIESKRSLQKSESKLKSEINKQRPTKKSKDSDSPYKDLKTPKALIVGHKYFSIDLKQTITLKMLDHKKKMAKVSKGALTISCPASGLRDTDLNKQSNHSSHNISFKTDGNSNIEYDCRGMRLEEFQSLVETVSAELIIGAIPFVNMIHGHGTGVLKTWLRNYIKSNKDLMVIKDTTGNDGETRFTINN